MLDGMRARVVLGVSAVLFLGCDRRGYAPVPQVPGYAAYPGYSGSPSYPPAYQGAQAYPVQPSQVPSGTLGAAWSHDPRVAQVPGWGGPMPSRGATVVDPASGAPRQAGGELGARAADAAIARYGLPYCWGGTGPDCFDCSGLTSEAWRAAGLSIPRTSELQREKLAPVAMNELRPGDILWRPGHVGLYVGNGWAIHAPGTGKSIQYQPASKFDEARRPY